MPSQSGCACLMVKTWCTTFRHDHGYVMRCDVFEHHTPVGCCQDSHKPRRNASQFKRHATTKRTKPSVQECFSKRRARDNVRRLSRALTGVKHKALALHGGFSRLGQTTLMRWCLHETQVSEMEVVPQESDKHVDTPSGGDGGGADHDRFV